MGIENPQEKSKVEFDVAVKLGEIILSTDAERLELVIRLMDAEARRNLLKAFENARKKFPELDRDLES